MREDINHLLFTTTRIITLGSAGTGFIMEYQWPDDHYSIFLVTNRHVVKDAEKGEIVLAAESKIKGYNVTLGDRIIVNILEKYWKTWFMHPKEDIDIAVLNMIPILQGMDKAGKPPSGICLGPNQIPNKNNIEEIKIGKKVIFIGYPAGVHDERYNLPIARTGTIATLPSIDYNGDPTFLIDASVFPGSSGSPVCSKLGGKVYLLGIISAGYYPEIVNNDKKRGKEWIDLGVVFKTHTILDTIELLAREKGY